MGLGGVPFVVLRALQLAGDKYCSALRKIAPPGHDQGISFPPLILRCNLILFLPCSPPIIACTLVSATKSSNRTTQRCSIYCPFQCSFCSQSWLVSHGPFRTQIYRGYLIIFPLSVLIFDPLIHAEGNSMWKTGFGAGCLMAEWTKFLEILKKCQNPPLVEPLDSCQVIQP